LVLAEWLKLRCEKQKKLKADEEATDLSLIEVSGGPIPSGFYHTHRHFYTQKQLELEMKPPVLILLIWLSIVQNTAINPRIIIRAFDSLFI
jgi:hypothetical protein